MKKYQVDNVCGLTLELSKATGRHDFNIYRAAYSLQELANKARKNAENLCNGWIEQDKYDRRMELMNARAFVILKDASLIDPIDGLKIHIELGGDPRGSCLHIHHTSIKSNSMGDGYAL